MAIVGQYSAVNAQALGFTHPNPDFSYWLEPVETQPQKKQNLRTVVARTCNPQTQGRHIIIGNELRHFRGASHLGQFTQTAWEPNAKLGKVLGT